MELKDKVIGILKKEGVLVCQFVTALRRDNLNLI
jgi:hypothetical protein